MKVQELMERVGSTQTGRIIAYIKDGLEEINMISETHVDTVTIDITQDQRFYKFPDDMVKIYLGQFDVYCPLHTDKSIYPNFYHTAYVGECMDTVVDILLMDKYSHFVKYAEYGNPKYKSLVLHQLHKAIQYQLIE